MATPEQERHDPYLDAEVQGAGNGSETDESPLMSKKTGMIALGMGVVLTLGIVAGYAASTGFGTETTTSEPSAAVSSSESQSNEPELAPLWSSTGVSLLTLENGGVVDPEVTAWHDGAAPRIGIAVSILNRPISQTVGELTRLCYSIRLTAEGLERLPEAPREDVNSAFQAWVSDLKERGTSCESRKDSESDEQFVNRARQSLGATQVSFETFAVAIDPYIDFNALPAPSAPATP